MLNGTQLRIDVKPQNLTEITNSEAATDSYEFQMFSLKDIHPESSQNSNFPLSPSTKALRLLASQKTDETSTNFTNIQSRKMTEEVKSSLGTSITEFRLATINSPEGNKCIDIVMGLSPCAAYCGRCKNYVHTVIDYQDSFFPKYFLKFSQAFIMCCGNPDWVNKLIIHRCPYCYIILGKV